ncbi:NAD(P)-binding protein [Auricularia subglabra TFB-10046 SS5]|nr:NAD(P)-binding protein [Auricularia subglabra TFB-10046 SS5]
MAVRVLSSSEVDKAVESLSLQALMDLMARVFRALSTNATLVQCPHRASLTMPEHTALVMPGRMDGLGTAIKVVSVPTRGSGLPASILVLDEATGAVKALVNGGALTALRTAAGSALATRLLLGPSAQPTRLVAFGAGAQIRAHVRLLLELYPSLSHCTIVNRTSNERVSSLIAHFATTHANVQFEAMVQTDRDGVQSVVHAANILVAATSSTVPLFENEWVQPRTHIILVGSYKPTMREAPDDLIRRAKCIVVDSRDACAIEAGELITAGVRPEDMIELGELVEGSNTEALRRRLGDVTIFKSVGIAAQDVAIACSVVEQAEQLCLGILVDFDA